MANIGGPPCDEGVVRAGRASAPCTPASASWVLAASAPATGGRESGPGRSRGPGGGERRDGGERGGRGGGVVCSGIPGRYGRRGDLGGGGPRGAAGDHRGQRQRQVYK